MARTDELLKQIDSAKSQLDGLRPFDREMEERVMQKFRLWWTYHSNAIEGNTLTQGETEMFLMEGLTAKGKPLKDHLDLRGHSNAINYLLGFIREKEVLTEAAIRKLHEILLIEPYQVQAITPDGLPTMKTVALGQYKTQPNHVRTPTGETHYYARPEETPARMLDLMEWYRGETGKGTMHPVEIAARYHHQFTAIHPFDDGNGRMSRLLMNLMLMQQKFPPVVIRLGERDQYLAALRRADADEFDDFFDFIAEHVLASLELYMRAVKGGEIHEPTDLEKEITLLKLELKHVEEPEPVTVEGQKRFFENSLDPLLAEIGSLMSPLCELFLKSVVSFEAERFPLGRLGEADGLRGEIDLLETRVASRPTGLWDKGKILKNYRYNIALDGFKKGGFDTFNLASALMLKFEPLKYSLQFPFTSAPDGPPRLILIQHFYQQALTRDEVTQVAQTVVRFFLDAIRNKTSEHS